MPSGLDRGDERMRIAWPFGECDECYEPFLRQWPWRETDRTCCSCEIMLLQLGDEGETSDAAAE